MWLINDQILDLKVAADHLTLSQQDVEGDGESLR